MDARLHSSRTAERFEAEGPRAIHSLLFNQIQRVLDQTRIQALPVSGNHHINRELLQPPNGNRPLLEVGFLGVSRPVTGEDHATSEEQFPNRKIHNHLIRSLRGTGVKHSDLFPAKRQLETVLN